MIAPLSPSSHHRVWGRTSLPDWVYASANNSDPIGEVWFEEDAGADLLVKFLFTSERLSIQVHPDDAQAQSRGYPRGKDEAWFVLDADADATIGLGLRRDVTSEELRAAAMDGSIVDLVDWRPVQAGDFFYSPAGTVHAIGPGLSLIEIQQNLDLTYRLYDYGRPRELHLEDGVAVSDPVVWRASFEPRTVAPGRRIMAAGGAFVVEHWTLDAPTRLSSAANALLIPKSGSGRLDGQELSGGSVWRAEAAAEIVPDEELELLVAYPGSDVMDGLRQDG